MSQFDKLLQRIRSLDKNLRFEELQKILERFEIKDEKLANLINEYVEGAASEINPEQTGNDIVESEDESDENN